MLPIAKNDLIKRPGGGKYIRLINIKKFIAKIIRNM